jgi:AcrR family transcriptional regulator
MPRTVIEEDYATKRNEILDSAQKWIATKGYSQMSIQDILNDLKISKGAFYHYFSSKQALMEALVDRVEEEIVATLQPVVRDPDLPALIKFQHVIDSAASWKTARKEFLLALVKVWYADENALFRLKMQAAMIARTAYLMTDVIAQGIREGAFATPFPDQVGEIVFSLLLGLGDATINTLLHGEMGPDTLEAIEAKVTAYTFALEQVLGTPAGSLKLFDMAILKEWFSVPA